MVEPVVAPKLVPTPARTVAVPVIQNIINGIADADLKTQVSKLFGHIVPIPPQVATASATAPIVKPAVSVRLPVALPHNHPTFTPDELKQLKVLAVAGGMMTKAVADQRFGV